MTRYLDRLAEHLDQRTADLGAQVAAEPPRWAADLLGAVPDRDDAEARAEWERKAGAVAACRTLTGREDADGAEAAPSRPSTCSALRRSLGWWSITRRTATGGRRWVGPGRIGRSSSCPTAR
ncbi:hypothetical protein [Pseudonocardia sp. ICBG1293]|uniref:hypothetical protein n=1 Tax=Pseudonocardia sp. ICBG1293 TaxID=2844382 RepID=UPI001CCC9FF9|nr:hypothetical protein [Pseudonocardia sp. ICBG1293]